MEKLQILWTRLIEHAGDTSRIEACLLVLSSIWILATILRVRRGVVAPADTCRRLADMLQKGDLAGAVTFCRRDSSAVARVLRDFLPIAAHSRHITDDLNRVEEREMGLVLRARDPILWIAGLAVLVGFVGGLSRMAFALQTQYHDMAGIHPQAHPIPYQGLWEAIQHVTEGLLIATVTLPWAWWLRSRAEKVTSEARVFIRGVLASYIPSSSTSATNILSAGAQSAPQANTEPPADAAVSPTPPVASPPITAAKP